MRRTVAANTPWNHDRPAVGERVQRRVVADFVISVIDYPEGARTSSHSHACAGFAITLHGAFEKRIGTRVYASVPGLSTLEPPGTVHAETFVSPSRTLLIEVQPGRLQHLREWLPELRSPIISRDSRVISAARMVYSEFLMRDTASSVGLEAAASNWIATTARRRHDPPVTGAAPRWLSIVEERLANDWRTTPSLDELAALAGVHPAHLTRVFRRCFGASIGEFLRARRVERAADALLSSRESLATVALSAGFCDQSHFTRVFARVMGTPPAQYRRIRLAASRIERDGE